MNGSLTLMQLLVERDSESFAVVCYRMLKQLSERIKTNRQKDGNDEENE